MSCSSGGGGPLKHDLEKRIADAGLSDRVKLLGYVADDDVPALYHACDVFCLSSVQKTEAFGIVQIEAMSCGKPLVATRIPDSGVAWVNKDGYSGINVAPSDPEAMASAIMTLMADTEVYAMFSRNSRARFNEMFTEEKMIENCLGLYERLLCN